LSLLWPSNKQHHKLCPDFIIDLLLLVLKRVLSFVKKTKISRVVISLKARLSRLFFLCSDDIRFVQSILR
jgi:hypothetical protein